ncbi:MAG: undecaprenyl-diphosphate phosphatase [Candidatus Daviesbacteria bacterium]|nr:undecaprenyl-diphosphate phosphatase [Candidatus Daviesbacteria bacterium]
MDLFQVIILSITEGLSEFLPISSTGHLILMSDLLKINQTEFVKSFEIIIQLGAILAVVVLYFKTLISKTNLWVPLLLAFLPTAILGLVFYKLVKTYLLGNSEVTLIAIFAGGVFFIIFEKLYKSSVIRHQTSDISHITKKQALIIGLCQSISMIPGVSRSASTILGGLFVGLSRKTALEFSFLLAIPTMIAATGLDLFKTGFNFDQQEITFLIIGLFGAFITALLAIKFFLNFVQNHTFIPFGIYRILLALAFWFFLIRN